MMEMLNNTGGIWGASCTFAPLIYGAKTLDSLPSIPKTKLLRTIFYPQSYITCTCFILKLCIKILLHAENFAVIVYTTLLPPPVLVLVHIHHYS